MTTIIRSNAQGTVNRAQIRKLAEQGRLEGRVDYYFDGRETHTSSGDAGWKTVGVRGTPTDKPEAFVLDEHDFESSSGRAYIGTEGSARVGRLLLRVHQNLVYELRVKPETLAAAAAPKKRVIAGGAVGKVRTKKPEAAKGWDTGHLFPKKAEPKPAVTGKPMVWFWIVRDPGMKQAELCDVLWKQLFETLDRYVIGCGAGVGKRGVWEDENHTAYAPADWEAAAADAFERMAKQGCDVEAAKRALSSIVDEDLTQFGGETARRSV